MKLGTYIVLKFTKGRGRHLVRSPYVVFKCDHCSKVGSRKFSDIRSDLHFCDRNCADKNRSRDGKIRTRIENRRQSNDPGSKKASTKAKQTKIERFGSDKWSEVPEILQKICDSTKLAMEEFGNARKLIRLKELYGPGIISTFQIPVVREKSKQTCQEKYGCDHHSQTLNHRERQRLLAIHIATSRKKMTSTIEDEFANLLVKSGISIKRQVFYEGRIIDFQIDEKTFIQFDGVYWHGLDRPLKVLEHSSGPQARSIYRRFLIDRAQDKLFLQRDLNLIRVTDVEFVLAKRTGSIVDLLLSKGIMTDGND